MHYYHKFAIIGFILGLFPIVFGIIALTTPTWIVINRDRPSHRISYDLFQQCTTNGTAKCKNIDSLQIPQYFEIIGYITLIVGLLVGVLCTALIDKRPIHYIAPLILMIGTVTILLGFIFYIKSVVEDIPDLSDTKLTIGYSMVLMMSTCIIGCILTAYFSFSAGYIHRHILATVNIY